MEISNKFQTIENQILVSQIYPHIRLPLSYPSDKRRSCSSRLNPIGTSPFFFPPITTQTKHPHFISLTTQLFLTSPFFFLFFLLYPYQQWRLYSTPPLHSTPNTSPKPQTSSLENPSSTSPFQPSTPQNSNSNSNSPSPKPAAPPAEPSEPECHP